MIVFYLFCFPDCSVFQFQTKTLFSFFYCPVYLLNNNFIILNLNLFQVEKLVLGVKKAAHNKAALLSTRTNSHFFSLLLYFFDFIAFIGAQVSGVQLNKTSSAHRLVHLLPQVKSPSAPISPHLPFPLAVTALLPVSVCYVYTCMCLLIPSLFSPRPTTPLSSDSCQSVLCIHAFISIVFISLFCSYVQVRS